MDSSSNSTHREYTFEGEILLKPKGLVLLFVSTELSNDPPVMLKTQCAGWFFYQLDTIRGIWKERALVEESPPSEQPARVSVGRFLG